ncbi:MAG: signal peptide peptidase SppA [Calditrichaeota bacterium]|nr:signal peptide peptidase SppA [Calditrichota bacterium]
MRLKEWQKLALIIVVIFILVAIIEYAFFKSLEDTAPPISRDSFLEIVLGGEIPERTIEDPFREILEGKPHSLQDIIQSVRKAKRDEKIRGIILRTFPLLTSWATVEELRDVLQDFRSTGKPVYAYFETASNLDYYLLSLADSIFVAPVGVLIVNGLTSSPIFLKGLLKKIGVEADFVAYGKYKSAPEMFTRDRLSEPAREVTNALLDDHYQRFLETIARERQMTPERLRQLIDQGLFYPRQAQEVGLVDSTLYYNDFKEFLKTRFKKRLRFVSLKRYKAIPASKLGIVGKKKLAVIFGLGTIVVGTEGLFGQNGLITSDGMANSIRKAADDKSIAAIILRIDSPGGSATAADIIWREVIRARKKKPVIVSVGGLAASGGYYISMAADTIVAHPSSLVGSIGVFAGKFALQGLYQKLGIQKEELFRGRNASFFSEYRKFTPEQRRLLRAYIMEVYRDFVAKAAQGRNKSFEEIDRVAQGRVWTGRQALDIGLVDILGDFATAVAVAKQMAGIPEEEGVKLIFYPKIKSLMERLLGSSLQVLQGIPGHRLQWLRELEGPYRGLLFALNYFSSGEPLLLCPIIPNIR